MIAATSSIQAAILADERRVPGAHQIGVLFQVDGDVSPGRVRRALTALQARHALLRSTFRPVDGELVREVRSELTIPLHHLHVGRAEAEDSVRAASAVPVDTTSGPPARAALYTVGPSTHLLHLLLHHYAYDAVTATVVARELLHLLADEAPGPAWADHELFAATEASWAGSREADEQRAAARRRVYGRTLRLPVPTVGPARVQRATRARWAADTTPAPLAFARFLAAWWLVLADWLGTDDFALGTTASLRRGPLKTVFGPVFQYVPLVPEIVRGTPLQRAAEAARAELHAALASAWVPLRDVVPGSDTHLGLNANLNFYDFDRQLPEPLRRMRAGEPQAFGSLVVRELPVPEAEIPRPYDLNLGVARSGGRYTAQLRYRPDLFDGAGAGELLDALGARLGLLS